MAKQRHDFHHRDNCRRRSAKMDAQPPKALRADSQPLLPLLKAGSTQLDHRHQPVDFPSRVELKLVRRRVD
jgi:hypothetical protein